MSGADDGAVTAPGAGPLAAPGRPRGPIPAPTPGDARVRAPEGRQRAVRIGLSGPIGCGKSTVARWLAARGAAVVDADAVARAVTEPGEPAHDAICARFGDPVRGAGGVLDRAALARLVFADEAALRDLEAIVHPAVRPRILAAMDAADAAGVPAVVVEAIKLVESGLADACDEVWLVTCGPATQRERLAGRGMAPADAERRIAAQGDIDGRVGARATRILATDGEAAAAEERAAAALAAAIAAARSRGSAGDEEPGRGGRPDRSGQPGRDEEPGSGEPTRRGEGLVGDD